ncbi:MAG: efflux RND transporter periplasmic adaptor subunit [Rhodovibrionaceae bacterium]|nr:efflux RND transporter periplasmic adaptor subunit [Rhodovibrionaceae bacterium]
MGWVGRQRLLGTILAGLLAWAVPTGVVAQSDGPPVTAAIAEIQPITHVAKLSATVISPRAAKVSTAVGGLVESVEVDFGDKVRKGDSLIRLDRALAEQEVRRAEAAVAEAQATLADQERRLTIAERLIKRGNIPQNELDARSAEVRIASAAVERLKAEAARQREVLKRHVITAPFDGVVARKATEAGEWVSPGASVIELVSTETLHVDIPVPQRYFPQLSGDAPVELQFDALPGKTFSAEQVALVPVSDPTARTFTLRVRPKAAGVPLTPGMSARAAIHLATGNDGVVVPRDAVIRHPDGRVSLWVVQEDDGKQTVSERRVELGRAFDGRVHIVSGLDAGERIVVRGNESLRQNQRVRVVDGAS